MRAIVSAVPGRADRDLEAVSLDLAVEVGEHRPDVLPAGGHRGARRSRPAREEAVGQPDGTELEAAGGEHLAPLADQDLGRPAADVDEQRPLLEHRHRLEDTEVDQPRLLEPRDHLDLDLRLLAGAADEDVGVGGLAGGAGGDRPEGDDPVALGDPSHALQAGDRPIHRVRRHLLHVGAAVAEAHDLLLAADDLEVLVTRAAGDDHVEAVRSEVEGGETSFIRGHYPLIRCGAHRDTTEHTFTEAIDLLERAADLVVVEARVAERDRRQHRLVEVARRDLAAGFALLRAQLAPGQHVGRPCAHEAVVGERSRLTGERAAEQDLGLLGPSGGEQVADGEVGVALDRVVVQLLGERFVEVHLVRRGTHDGGRARPARLRSGHAISSLDETGTNVSSGNSIPAPPASNVQYRFSAVTTSGMIEPSSNPYGRSPSLKASMFVERTRSTPTAADRRGSPSTAAHPG